MSPNFQVFKDLHRSADLFVLPNVWDAKSARFFQERQFRAIATSSAAVAHSLGYEDGEGMPFDEYLFVIKRILSSVQIPLSVDLEMGYGPSDKKIVDNILKLIDLGVVGINIEDSTINGSVRTLKEAEVFARTIEFIKSRSLNLFINIRCDTYILDVENKRKETARRLKIYEAAGADGIFLPCIVDGEDITEAINTTRLPLNVMYLPGLPGFEVLQKLGVRRVSMGPFLFSKVYDHIGQVFREIAENN